MIVVDASAMLETLLQTSAAQAVRRRLFSPGETLHAPHLLDVEVAQVVRRYALAGEIDAERGQTALGTLVTFPIRRYAHEFLLPRIWQLRNNLSAYDAVYVALAEVLDAPLVTCDRRLLTAASRHASVELIGIQ
jgi:predicted nucleic acid-binding protein